MGDFFAWDGRDLLLHVRVQPKAAQDRIAGLHGDALKVRITAPPTDGKANRHLARLLAKELRVPKGAVTVEKGEKGKDKTLRLAGADPEVLAAARAGASEPSAPPSPAPPGAAAGAHSMPRRHGTGSAGSPDQATPAPSSSRKVRKVRAADDSCLPFG
ncbi:MAG: DUF167 family protein [Thiohalorhabdus sp.]